MEYIITRLASQSYYFSHSINGSTLTFRLTIYLGLFYGKIIMDNEDSRAEQQSNKPLGKNTLLFIALGTSIFILIIAIILVISLKIRYKPVTSYTNPFAPQTQQKTSQNPFAVPTTTYQNPFTTQNQQSANKPYQNPFSGGKQ